MSDSKRATLITVGATKSAKNNVTKTVRLTINLDESNESKYPELNYKELVKVEERKKRVQNGKTTGLDPFSDNDDDVERVARKFEQKYGGKSTYGRKGRSKHDDFADIGAGYDENDSFIDNTDGYDEMIPPECDTYHGGFYINSGSLEFKTVPENQIPLSDGEHGGRRNKRRISSSSSEEESSESSSASDSRDGKQNAVTNGTGDSHDTEHRKKKNKKLDKKKAKKIQRTDSSAATSGKQTSDENVQGDGESADSRTSQSDSLASKPAPSSENAVTSDSSRDVEAKEIKLPDSVSRVLDELDTAVKKSKQLHTDSNPSQLQDEHVNRCLLWLDSTLQTNASPDHCRVAWSRAAKCVKLSRSALQARVKQLLAVRKDKPPPAKSTTNSQPTETKNTANTAQMKPVTLPVNNAVKTCSSNKRKASDDDSFDVTKMTQTEREAKIEETLQRLKVLIEERTPGMMATYNAECSRVQEERKKLQVAAAVDGGPVVEKRLPKRRFPWCPRSRALLARIKRYCLTLEESNAILTQRALPMFPHGFVRLPTLLRQAELNKEAKAVAKRQRVSSIPQSKPQQLTQSQTFTEPIMFPPSLTVTTTVRTSPDKPEPVPNTNDKEKSQSIFGTILNNFNISKDLIVETDRKEPEKSKEDVYIPPNSIGSITITPVPNSQTKTEKKVEDKHKDMFIRVKSPAAVNEMYEKEVAKKDKHSKKVEKSNTNHKEKSVITPLHIDTSHQTLKKDHSPKTKDEITRKQIENMKAKENNIPRPTLVPVHHSPTFAKPDKRPPENKKKKEVLIVSDVDPLAINQNETLAIDDSSSDVEVIEETKTDKYVKSVSDIVPSKDNEVKKTDSAKFSFKVDKSKEAKVDCQNEMDNDAAEDIDTIMRNIKEMEYSQEQSKLNSHGVITSERISLNKMDGCKSVTG